MYTINIWQFIEKQDYFIDKYRQSNYIFLFNKKDGNYFEFSNWDSFLNFVNSIKNGQGVDLSKFGSGTRGFHKQNRFYLEDIIELRIKFIEKENAANKYRESRKKPRKK
jgi:hypothetical protein